MIGEIPVESGENRRKLKRKYMLFKIPVYDARSRRFLGLVQDITEQGLQLFGVKVETDLTVALVIQASDYVKSSSLRFDAVCRWTLRENPHGYYVSGFEIVSISEEAKGALKQLMDLVTLG